jgi:hypothetical protein
LNPKLKLYAAIHWLLIGCGSCCLEKKVKPYLWPKNEVKVYVNIKMGQQSFTGNSVEVNVMEAMN